MNKWRVLRSRRKLLRCQGNDYSSVGVSARANLREERSPTGNPRYLHQRSLVSFTFVQHGESIHVRYTGASEVQVNVGTTINDTDVVLRHSVRGRVVTSLIAQQQVTAFQYHRAEQAGA